MSHYEEGSINISERFGRNLSRSIATFYTTFSEISEGYFWRAGLWGNNLWADNFWSIDPAPVTFILSTTVEPIPQISLSTLIVGWFVGRIAQAQRAWDQGARIEERLNKRKEQILYERDKGFF